MEKTEKELLEDANSIIRSFKSVIDRKGINTNWDALEKRVNEILKEEHEFFHPTIKQLRLRKLKTLNDKNSE